jgi:hypothetical protein
MSEGNQPARYSRMVSSPGNHCIQPIRPDIPKRSWGIP